MRIAIPVEHLEGECRVALVPDSVTKLIETGMEVSVETGAGANAHFSDAQYQKAGAIIINNKQDLYAKADIILKINKPSLDKTSGPTELDMTHEGTVWISFLEPLTNPQLTERLREGMLTSFSMDTIPRIARAQGMDALTSMASISGYKAALIAAGSLGKYLPMMVTAAGTVAPAKGLVLGAGVAGLQAIATARRLGASMFAFDVRPSVKEQVESLGATFITNGTLPHEIEDQSGYAQELSKESQQHSLELIHKHIPDMDFVISTAMIPGKPAPILITADMARTMKPGSVIVDIAAAKGGNCELTKPGLEIIVDGVTINGPLNLPSTVPTHASQLYSRNISNFLLHLSNDGNIHLDLEDTILSSCCITHAGKILHTPSLKNTPSNPSI